MSKPKVHPIAAAVEPLRAESVRRALAYEAARLERLRLAVEAQPDLVQLAPLAPRDASYVARMHAQRKRADYCRVTTLDRVRQGTGYHGGHEWVVWDPDGAKKEMDWTEHAAGLNHDRYIAKLIGKCEAGGRRVRAADVESVAGVWEESLLRVTYVGGLRECWRTRMIWNRSVLGKYFAQYPTRLQKDAKP